MEGIIKKNLPVLGANLHSYEQQIRSAFRRRDRVSLNHRTAAWLARYFDILWSPGEKSEAGDARNPAVPAPNTSVQSSPGRIISVSLFGPWLELTHD